MPETFLEAAPKAIFLDVNVDGLERKSAFVVVGPLKITNESAATSETERDACVPEKVTTFVCESRIVEGGDGRGHLFRPDSKTELVHQVDKTHGRLGRLESGQDIVDQRFRVFFFFSSSTK